MSRKLFVRRGAAVLLLIALFFALEQLVSYFVLPSTNYIVPTIADRREYDGRITTALLGASLIVDGVDPALLDESMGGVSFNLGSNAQSMQCSYYALEDILVENPVKTAVIELSICRMVRDTSEEAGLAQVSFFDWLLNWQSRGIYLRELCELDDLPRMFLMSARCQIQYFLDNPFVRFTPSYLKEYLKNGYVAVQSDMESYGGRGHVRYKGFMERSDAVDTTDGFLVLGEEGEENALQLRRIVARCREAGVEPVLVVVPVSDSQFIAYEDSYEQVSDYFQSLAQELDARYYDFNYSRYIQQHLSDAHFKDPKHMNQLGADMFTPLLAQAILGELDESDFYSEYSQVHALARARLDGE